MIISLRNLETYVSEGESRQELSKKILTIKGNSDMKTADFVKAVGIDGISLADAAGIYADIQKSDGSNVIRFENRGNKVVRFPLWEGGAC